MKKIIFIALIALSSTSWGVTRIHAGKEAVVVTFDYNGKSYKQTLSIKELEKTQGFHPLEDSIDVKAIANTAIKKANDFDPDKSFSVVDVNLRRMGRNELWYVSVSIGEPITPQSQTIIPEFTLLFSVSGASAEVVEE
jgi:hypothetical protein